MAISVVFTIPFPDIYADWVSKSLRASWQETATPYVRIADQSIRAGSLSDLRRMSDQIVAKFDREQLEPARKPYREAVEYLKGFKPGEEKR